MCTYVYHLISQRKSNYQLVFAFISLDNEPLNPYKLEADRVLEMRLSRKLENLQLIGGRHTLVWLKISITNINYRERIE